MSRPDRVDTEAPFDASIRTIDLRIAVGRHYDLGFDERAAGSNSNSLAAIYFTRRQLDVIGRDLGIDVEELNKPELQDAIRTAVGCDPRSPEGLDWIELKSLVLEAGVDVDPSGYDIDALDIEPDSEDRVEEPAEDDGFRWTDWGGGQP